MQCCICFYDMKWYNKKTLHCNHCFHRKCLNEWFKKKQTCPCCRGPVQKPKYSKSYKKKKRVNVINGTVRRD